MKLYDEILKKINEYDMIIIHRHMRPDPDAIGSQVGLKLLLQYNFPEKTVKAVGYDEPTLTWLARMDQATIEDYKNALVIICDTANQPRIDGTHYDKGEYLIKIDHHPNDDVYGDISWVDTSSSSTSELIALFAMENDLKLCDDVARLLYAGIVGDTGRFLYPATTQRTFEIASYLRSHNFDFVALSRQMDSVEFKIAKLQGFVYDHLEINETGAARVLLTQKDLKYFEVTDAETAAIVGAPGRIRNVEAWAIFVEQADGHYRVRLRSKSHTINQIAKNHDGGGHPLASGANSYSIQENEQIYQELIDLLKKS
ncbi:3'-to-5' oligoribonuclease A [Streptococcus sp. DD10]|uniref:DHH family phosphoesterase n=1 Tax=Streptococcus sp. DD10 TaxID=1777878 RepID=UPI00079A77D9|nr:bifunctional oligoribonuclease/PAP phosphatase NrnA [Streptococcus sp. DD10]KXT77040.1 3'-to-5' oligoribonuclease A [Streptococcus sp. DD10]